MYQLKPLQTITSLRPRLVKLFHLMHNRGEKILHQWRTPSLANKFIEKKLLIRYTTFSSFTKNTI